SGRASSRDSSSAALMCQGVGRRYRQRFVKNIARTVTKRRAVEPPRSFGIWPGGHPRPGAGILRRGVRRWGGPLASASGQPQETGRAAPAPGASGVRQVVLISLAFAATLLASCDRTAGERQAAMAQRLQRVEDELAIHRLLVDYSATQDARDYQAYAALFARDGEWVNGNRTYKGREAILAMLNDLYGPTPPGYVNNESYHITSNPQVDVQGDRATARSRHLLVMRGPN